MEISEEQYARIKDSLPVQRGNVSLSNLQVLNAILLWRNRVASGVAAETVWPLPHDLHAYEPVGEKRRIGPCV